MSTTMLYVDDEESDSHPKTYTRGEIVPFEEDIVHEFKGHRTISVENRMPDLTKSGEFIKTRQQWSKYLCGMLNSGFGGILYGGETEFFVLYFSFHLQVVFRTMEKHMGS